MPSAVRSSAPPEIKTGRATRRREGRLGLDAPLTSSLIGSVLLGAGTAMVYPALLAAVSGVAHPSWRATSLGVYRFWRDLGYAVGALMAGVVAAFFGLVWAVHVAGMLTFFSGLVAWACMTETFQTSRAIGRFESAEVEQ
jgi:hypothetical protein